MIIGLIWLGFLDIVYSLGKKLNYTGFGQDLVAWATYADDPHT